MIWYTRTTGQISEMKMIFVKFVFRFNLTSTDSNVIPEVLSYVFDDLSEALKVGSQTLRLIRWSGNSSITEFFIV